MGSDDGTQAWLSITTHTCVTAAEMGWTNRKLNKTVLPNQLSLCVCVRKANFYGNKIIKSSVSFLKNVPCYFCLSNF